MYHTSISNHDNERQTAFVLLTSRCLYILTNHLAQTSPWKTEACVKYEELDYVSVRIVMTISITAFDLLPVTRKHSFHFIRNSEAFLKNHFLSTNWMMMHFS